MSAGTLRWHIVTGEYPPQPGGVSDYTYQVARGLAQAGDQVTVWAPEVEGPPPADCGVTVHRLPGYFGPGALRELSAAMRLQTGPFRLLVQYVPQMFGCRGMNLPFCFWLSSLRRYRPWVMFHEVACPWEEAYLAKQNLLAVMQRIMAGLVIRHSRRVFVSIPKWEPMLPRTRRVEWLPIPSNLPVNVASTKREAIRATVVPPGSILLGHFGTYGGTVAPLLSAILPTLLVGHENRHVLLLGRNSVRFAQELQCSHPALAHRILSSGEQPADTVAAYLSACDLLIQPFPDGASSRRGSLMAGLALGVPIITNRGHLTEPIWSDGAVALVDNVSADVYRMSANAVLGTPAELERLGRAGAAFYKRWFTLQRTLAILRDEPAK